MVPQLLHVISAQPSSVSEADDALRAIRRCHLRCEGGQTVLLFCDLPASPTAVSPDDAAIIRRLQSGVMASENMRPGQFILLVRSRSWDDAARIYLGRGQKTSVRQVIGDLLCAGKTDTSFQAATLSLSAFQDRFAYVLFSDLSLACTPDTPQKMLALLKARNLPCIGAQVVPGKEAYSSILSRLEQDGFSLSALVCALQDRLRQKGLSLSSSPVLFAASAIRDCRADIPAASDCFFVRRHAPTLHRLFEEEHERLRHAGSFHVLLPALQMILLFLSGLLGAPRAALFCILLPELWSLLHPRLLPGALLRLSLLPLYTACALDAGLCHLLARSAFLRVRVPSLFFSPASPSAAGALLIIAALSGTNALYLLLPVGLLWLAAPLILRAVSKPVIERIPLSREELSRLHTLARHAFSSCFHPGKEQSDCSCASSPRRMLIACAGAMLGLLEPDEAARHAQHCLSSLQEVNAPVHDPVDQACMLASAQYLREQMQKCDAALRSLPTQIDSFVLSRPVPEVADSLSAFLSAAHLESAAPPLPFHPSEHSLEALFLPFHPAGIYAKSGAAFPFTHPHTFLSAQITHQDEDRFLALCAAALGHPFYALLCRSAVTAPYTLVFSLPHTT